MSEEITNRLYYGDNLDILRRYIPSESVDLVYLDPPFNSNRDYPRIQIITIRELLEDGKRPDLPAFVHQPYKRAEKVQLPNAAEQGALFGD